MYVGYYDNAVGSYLSNHLQDVILSVDINWYALCWMLLLLSLVVAASHFVCNFCCRRSSLRFIFTSLQLVLCRVEAVKSLPVHHP